MNEIIMKLVKDDRVFPTFEVAMQVAMRSYTLSRCEKDSNKAFAHLVGAMEVCDVAYTMLDKVFPFANIELSDWLDFAQDYLCNEYEDC